MSLTNQVSLMDMPRDVLCILISMSDTQLFTLRGVNRKLYILVTEMIFNSNTFITNQKEILRYWSFNQIPLAKDKFHAQFVLRVIKNPEFTPPERIPGLIIISPKSEFPIDSLFKHISKNLINNCAIVDSCIQILMRLLPQLTEGQLVSLSEAIIFKFSNLKMFKLLLAKSLNMLNIISKYFNPLLRSAKLREIIDRCCDSREGKFNTVLRLGLYSLTDDCPSLTLDQLNGLVNLIYEQDYEDAQLCLEQIAPKLIPMQIDSIYDPIVKKLKDDNPGNLDNEFKVLVTIINRLTIEQILETRRLTLILLKEKEIYPTSALKALVMLTQKLISEQRIDLIDCMTDAIEFSKCRSDFSKVWLHHLDPKTIRDGFPHLMKCVTNSLNDISVSDNVTLKIFTLELLFLINNHLTPADIEGIFKPLFESLCGQNRYVAELAVKVFQKFDTKLTKKQNDHFLTAINKGLTSGDVYANNEVHIVDLMLCMLPALDVRQLSELIKLVIYFEDSRTRGIFNELKTRFDEQQIDYIFDFFINRLFESNCDRHIDRKMSMALGILANLYEIFTEDQKAKIFEWMFTNLDNVPMFLFLNKFLPKLSDAYLNRILPLLFTSRSLELFQEIVSRLTPAQIDFSLQKILELSLSESIYDFKIYKALKSIVPLLNQEQCLLILEHFLPLLNVEKKLIHQREVYSIISYVMIKAECGYDKILQADVQQNPEGLLIHYMASVLKPVYFP